MDIDFPLILTIAVLLTGVIWGIDHFFFRPKRLQKVTEGLSDDQRESILKEPVIVEYAHALFPVLLIVYVLRSFLFEPYQIPTGSMIPTLAIGDFIVVNKYAYGLRIPVLGTKVIAIDEPQRGDVMVFIPPHETRYFIKRVIGGPGDTVTYRNRRLTVNGEVVPTELIAKLPNHNPPIELYQEQLGAAVHRSQRILIPEYVQLDAPPSPEGEWIVPAGHYFMMGDNRDNSQDSRYWSFVPDDRVVGKAVAVWMHKDDGWVLPTFSENRWIQ